MSSTQIIGTSTSTQTTGASCLVSDASTFRSKKQACFAHHVSTGKEQAVTYTDILSNGKISCNTTQDPHTLRQFIHAESTIDPGSGTRYFSLTTPGLARNIQYQNEFSVGDDMY